MLVLPFFFAAVFTFAITYLFRAGAKIPLQAVRKGKGVPGKVAARILPRVALIAQISLSVVLLTYFAVQVASYGLSDPDATFLSPSCTIAPASNDAIIAYLQKEHVHYAWAIQWVGNPIIFKTNNSIILADPRVIIFHYGLGRIQAYTEALLHADRPSMLSIVPHNKRYPAILRIMDAQHCNISYEAFSF